MDNVNRKRGGPQYHYPARELLGLPDQDLEMIREMIHERIAPRTRE